MIKISADMFILYDDGFVIVERKNVPYGWALPGGFLEEDETLEECAIREAKEETGLNCVDVKQVKTYSSLERDPRGRTVSTLFIGKGVGKLIAGDDAKSAKVVGFEFTGLIFDHDELVEDAKKVI